MEPLLIAPAGWNQRGLFITLFIIVYQAAVRGQTGSPAMLNRACRPEEHCLLTVYTGTVSGNPLQQTHQNNDQCQPSVLLEVHRYDQESRHLRKCAILAITAPAPGCRTLPARERHRGGGGGEP